MTGRDPGVLVPAATTRAAGFLLFWIALAGADPADLPAAFVAVAAATWVSLHLLPPTGRRLAPLAVARLVWRFPQQSVVAGLDVAWRALHPRLPLRPGFVTFAPRLPEGAACDTFCMLTSLLPGTVPAGSDAAGALRVHCLDTGQPVASQLAMEESLFMQVLDGARNDG